MVTIDQDALAERFEVQRSRLRAVAYRMLGSPFETDGVVVDTRHHWFRWTASGDGSRAEGTRAVEALGPARCRVVLGYDVGLTGAMRVLDPVFVRVFRRTARRNLRHLADLVASEAATAAV